MQVEVYLCEVFLSHSICTINGCHRPVTRFYIVGDISKDILRGAVEVSRILENNTQGASLGCLRKFLLDTVNACDIQLGINDWKVAGTLLGRVTIKEVEAWTSDNQNG